MREIDIFQISFEPQSLSKANSLFYSSFKTLASLVLHGSRGMQRKLVLRGKVTCLPKVPWASQLFIIYPYKTWQTVYTRNKKLAWPEG